MSLGFRSLLVAASIAGLSLACMLPADEVAQGFGGETFDSDESGDGDGDDNGVGDGEPEDNEPEPAPDPEPDLPDPDCGPCSCEPLIPNDPMVPTCAQSCQEDPVVDGLGCQLQCPPDMSCVQMCDAPVPCMTQAVQSNSVQIECLGGPSCVSSCWETGSCNLNCVGGGCHLTCVDGGDCTMTCPEGGCTMTCDGTASCALLQCPTGCSMDCLGVGECQLDCLEPLGCALNEL